MLVVLITASANLGNVFDKIANCSPSLGIIATLLVMAIITAGIVAYSAWKDGDLLKDQNK
ncbi:hypothetical protein [Candidatus Tokpelaia sp.]|uniref:hypothetical protein n=1 Tax=Candidatus Tokpelaia sp. TaxID=2233777 RepID=UPI00123B6A50|nr:hypothetical protein [Candidatus Tokpelaia sp.]KAA6405123.1 hypothetical protein DPQ22_06105 [Candidatus Tokpelaia sp.]